MSTKWIQTDNLGEKFKRLDGWYVVWSSRHLKFYAYRQAGGTAWTNSQDVIRKFKTAASAMKAVDKEFPYEAEQVS